MRDRETWHDAVHRVAKTQTWLSDWTTAMHSIIFTTLVLNYFKFGALLLGWAKNSFGISHKMLQKNMNKYFGQPNAFYHTACLIRRTWWHLTPALLPGKPHGQRSLVGCSPWGREESDTTERLHFHFSLACIGEGNGNPVQCSCLENPKDGGAWWAAIYGVTESRTTEAT